MALTTQSAFAASHGVSRKTATMWKAAGHLAMVGDQVDVAASDAKLRAAGLGRFKGATEPASPPAAAVDPDDPAALEDFLENLLRGRYVSKAEAQKVKENVLAAKRVLELKRTAGRLIEVDAAEAVLFETFRGARDSWLNWPARIGPILATDLGLEADTVTEALTAHVHQHLADLGEPQPGALGDA